ncbi:MAG: PCMD domain-containing protein [bacterium]|nr:PCMD domain-containing protein [bacterium]
MKLKQLIRKLRFCLYLFAGLITSTNLFAQTQFANPGFENWEERSFGGFKYEDPSNWFTLNQLQKFGFDQTTNKTSDAHGNSTAALLSTVSSAFGNIPGLLAGNPFLGADGSPDMNLNYTPFKGKPNSIQFWYKSFPESQDQSAMYCALTKWNSVNQNRDTLAEASWTMDSTVSIYTIANIPFVYKGTFEPDSIYIIFSSSSEGFSPIPGSELYIDDVQMNYGTSVKEVKNEIDIQLYPNPFEDKFMIESKQFPLQYSIIDAMGKKHLAGTITHHKEELNLGVLRSGIYYLVLVKTETLEKTCRLITKTN